MFSLDNVRVTGFLLPTSETNAGTITSLNIDLLGGGNRANEVLINVFATTSNVVSNKPSVFALQHADVTNTSSFGNITGFVAGTDWTIPNAVTATTDKPYATFKVDTRKLKRYLRLVISPVTTQTYHATAIFSRKEQAPVSASDINTQNVFNVIARA
jgi:hypothetical protein